jgi:hypothetical protein
LALPVARNLIKNEQLRPTDRQLLTTRLSSGAIDIAHAHM